MRRKMPIDPSRKAEMVPLEFSLVYLLQLIVIVTLINVAFRAIIARPFVNLTFGRLMRSDEDTMRRKLTGEEIKKREKTKTKFVGSMAEFVQYVVFFTWGCVLLSRYNSHNEFVILPSKEWWVQPNHSIKEISAPFALFYMSYAARYASNFIMVFTEPRKKDFFQMQLHHVTTAVLVSLSYAFGWVKVGVIIMVLLDFTDPFLHAAKMVTYWKEVSPFGSSIKKFFSVTADLMFGAFALSFFLTRIVVYTYVAWSVAYESVLYEATPHDFLPNLLNHTTLDHFICIALVLVVWGLQLFWFVLLMRVISKVVSGKELADERSDYSEVDEVAGASQQQRNKVE